jgi:hypothetical protein
MQMPGLTLSLNCLEQILEGVVPFALDELIELTPPLLGAGCA